MSSYPSSLTDPEREIVRSIVRETLGRPCTHSKREILDASLYIVGGGIPRRMIPNGLPHWKTVYHYFPLWDKLGIWQQGHGTLRDLTRSKAFE